MEEKRRDVIFISHATPGDNAFATWLASRLAMAGYKVWCDQEKLLGGEDFWQEIENALRHNTIKFVLVISKKAFDENDCLGEGIKNEIALANIMKKQLRDDYFIVPIRLDDTAFSDFSIDFIRLNSIDASKNWATGLHSLLKVLKRDGVSSSESINDSSLQKWRSIHQRQKQALEKKIEHLQSNWLSIKSLPEKMYFYDFRRPMKLSKVRAIASSCALPCSDHYHSDHHPLLVSFAKEDEIQNAIQDALDEVISVKLRCSLKTEDFIQGKTGQLSDIKPYDAKNKVTSMIRQGWNNLMRNKGLTEYQMSYYSAWWFPEGLLEGDKLKYTDFNNRARYRAVSGVKNRTKHDDGTVSARYHWHLGMTARPMLGENPVLILQPRVIISDSNKKILENKTQLNSVRKSMTKMWFNDKWRTMMLGFCAWLTNNANEFDISMAQDAAVTVFGKPKLFDVPISIKADPAGSDLTDEIAEKNDSDEEEMKLSDPAFLTPRDAEVEDE